MQRKAGVRLDAGQRLRRGDRVVGPRQFAGRPNGGLCVDSWHFFRGDPSFVDLARFGPVFMVQVNDGPAEPTDPTS